MRMEFLELGERLGWPRLPFRYGRAVGAGEPAWSTFASRAANGEIAPALRNARILVETRIGVENAEPPKATHDEVMAKRRAGLEKARLARSAKAAARRVAKEAVV